jgi:hypothetical protein
MNSKFVSYILLLFLRCAIHVHRGTQIPDNFVIPLKHLCTTCFKIYKFCILPTECTHVFRTIFLISRDHFHKHLSAGLCNWEAIYYLWGRDCIILLSYLSAVNTTTFLFAFSYVTCFNPNGPSSGVTYTNIQLSVCNVHMYAICNV